MNFTISILYMIQVTLKF